MQCKSAYLAVRMLAWDSRPRSDHLLPRSFRTSLLRVISHHTLIAAPNFVVVPQDDIELLPIETESLSLDLPGSKTSFSPTKQSRDVRSNPFKKKIVQASWSSEAWRAEWPVLVLFIYWLLVLSTLQTLPAASTSDSSLSLFTFDSTFET